MFCSECLPITLRSTEFMYDCGSFIQIIICVYLIHFLQEIMASFTQSHIIVLCVAVNETISTACCNIFPEATVSCIVTNRLVVFRSLMLRVILAQPSKSSLGITLIYWTCTTLCMEEESSGDIINIPYSIYFNSQELELRL